MRIAVIGAGAAGLSAGRHCLQQGHQVDIFEQTGNVGGTWNYTDCVGIDENGLPVHSSMYKGLRTNVPKELMCFEDFPYPDLDTSYISYEQVLDYIESYAENFRIKPHIQFYKRTTKVDPLESGKWFVEIEDAKTKNRTNSEYDAVIVCNGHYKDVSMPVVPGLDSFPGRHKHSHEYRSPESYQGKKVLVIGAGPSGTDIARQIVAVASQIYLSVKTAPTCQLPDGILLKPVLRRLRGDRAEFEDGSQEIVDEILFCTGYKYTFSFLTKKCGIEVVENSVRPLYKHIINIEHPTMCFLGIPSKVCPFPMMDIQIRFFLASLSNRFLLLSREEMLNEMEEELAKKTHLPLHHFHVIGEDQGRYFKELASIGNIKHTPPVISDLFMRVRLNRNMEDRFKIIDDNTYVQLQ